MSQFNTPVVIVALDYANANDALKLAEQLDPQQCRLKVGKELFTAAGPQLVEQLQAKGFSIFLDLKFHDVPNTVKKACLAAANLGVWMTNVHALGGSAMLAAAKQGIQQCRSNTPLLIAVTMLTSLDNNALQGLPIKADVVSNVLRLASLSQQQGLDGVVCSAQEAHVLRQTLGDAFCLVTPGIRPLGGQQHDQARVMTPVKALQAGSHYLVIGRPITQADKPLHALQNILDTIAK